LLSSADADPPSRLRQGFRASPGWPAAVRLLAKVCSARCSSTEAAAASDRAAPNGIAARVAAGDNLMLFFSESRHQHVTANTHPALPHALFSVRRRPLMAGPRSTLG